jgi:hypothetical protein
VESNLDFIKLTEAAPNLLEALELIYDKRENGPDCFEDPEDQGGYLGKAVNLSFEEENSILTAFEMCGIKTALKVVK